MKVGGDAAVELFLSRVLQWGVVLAGIVVLGAGGVYLLRHGTQMPRDAVFRGEPRSLEVPTTTLQAALAGDSGAMIQIGIFLLIGIPVSRVGLSAVIFLLQREWTYVVITLIVFAVLAMSLVGY